METSCREWEFLNFCGVLEGGQVRLERVVPVAGRLGQIQSSIVIERELTDGLLSEVPLDFVEIRSSPNFVA